MIASADFNRLQMAARLGSVIAASGRSLRDVARGCGLNESTLSRVVKGNRAMQAQTLYALCTELGASADYLLGLSDRKKEPTAPVHDGRAPRDGWLP